MTPRTILFIALGAILGIALAIVPKMRKPEALHVQFDERYFNAPTSEVQWASNTFDVDLSHIPPEEITRLNEFVKWLAHHHRTNRTMPGVRTNEPSMKRFPLEEQP